MARGAVAKQNVIQKIKEAFGENFIAEQDKKIYVWANDDGEQVQIALTLTCPKVFIECDAPVNKESHDWRSTTVTTVKPKEEKVEITPEEEERIRSYMEKFNL